MNKIWEKPTNVGTGRACAPYASDNAACTQPADCAPKGSTTLNVSTISMKGLKAGQNAGGATRAGHNDSGSTTCAPEVCTTSNVSTMPSAKKKSRKMLRFFTAGGLAIMMGIGTLCGVLIAPMGASAASANSQAGVLAGQNASGAALAQTADSAKAAHDAAILSGGDLGLDPENDPIVWVTDNGLEIKSHDVSVSSGTTTVSTVSYKYVTLGSYNWIIIGYSTKEESKSVSGAVNVGSTSYNDYISITNNTNIVNKLGTDSSPAGSTIKSECVSKNDRIYFSSAVSVPTKLKTIFTNAVGASEIPANCVLCLCAGTTGSSEYDATDSERAYFPNSTLDTAMTTVYNSISSAAGGAIQSTSLTTWWYNGSAKTKYTHSEYLFPLACNSYWDSSTYPQNYCVETYLSTYTTRALDVEWLLRSGNTSNSNRLFGVYTSGTFSTYYVGLSRGVRPAFVLSLV